MRLINNESKLIIFLVVGPLLLYTLFSFAFGYMLFGPMFCSQWRPNMSADEKIKMALEFSNSISHPSFLFKQNDGSVVQSAERQIPYVDINQIIKQNPDCCKLYSSETAHTKDPSETLSQYEDGTVRLEYKGQYQDRRGNVHAGTISNYFDLNTCRN